MKLVAEPQGPEIEWFRATEITEINYSLSGLRIVVAAAMDDDRFCEVHFAWPQAFQAIPESDMLSYWREPLGSGRFLYKVSSGGWVQRTEEHYFQVLSVPEPPSEWLVVADSGLVVTVLSADPPHLRTY